MQPNNTSFLIFVTRSVCRPDLLLLKCSSMLCVREGDEWNIIEKELMREEIFDRNPSTVFMRFAGKNLDRIFGGLSDLLQGAAR